MHGLWRFLVGVAALCFLVVSAIDLRNSLPETTWADFAERLTRSNAPVEPFREPIADRLASAPPSCAYGADRSRVDLALFVLRSSYRPSVSADTWSPAVSAAGRELREAVSCHPGDGGLWAVLAAVEVLEGSGDARLRDLLRISIARAPLEARALSTRSGLLVKLMNRPAFRADPSFSGDLANAARLLWPDEAAPILTALKASGRGDLAAEIMDGLPVEQQRRISSVGAKQPSGSQAWDKFRHFDFNPFGKGNHEP